MKRTTLSVAMAAVATLCMATTSCGQTTQKNETTTDSVSVEASTENDITTKTEVEEVAAPADTAETKKHPATYMELSRTVNLNIYSPSDDYTMDLVCENMPSPDEKDVIMCCEAAFTGQLLNKFKHGNIAGNHVSSGTYHKGYSCKANTGCFAYYPQTSTWKFVMNDYNKHLLAAADKGGCGFGQGMVIFNGKKSTARQPQKDNSRNGYRVLAERDGKLCIIDANRVMRYGDFVKSLLALGVTHAIYLDMGGGWNYSYYKDKDDNVHFIHDYRILYTTNWIVFKRK